MNTARLEAFSDGVIAIIITIMVLELKVPHEPTLAALRPVLPVFLSYVLSFIYVGIYWNNHHHMLRVVSSVSGPILWANLHLLFWLSVVPFVSAWMGENHLATAPVALYGVVLLAAAIAFTILSTTLIRHEGRASPLAIATGRDLKGKASIVLYSLGIAVAYFSPLAAIGLYFSVAMMWLIPDRRIERVIAAKPPEPGK